MHNHAFQLRTAAVLLIGALFLVPACENNEEPQPPTRISILSGDNQYSKSGTDLPEPLRVKVQYADLTDAPDVVVRFRSMAGDGSAAPATDGTDGHGEASARYTLGTLVGTQTIRAELVDDNSRYVDFTATAGEYYCPEEDPTYSNDFPSQGAVQRDLFLYTHRSSLNTSEGAPVSGVVRLAVEGGTLRTTSFLKEEIASWVTVHDASFSSSGNFYLSRLELFPEILRVMPNKSVRVFAAPESYGGSEITRGVEGVLVGCDEYGPFVVGCRDTLQRFDEALYAGLDEGDEASNDAVAVETDPQSPYFEDIYFIHITNRTLLRLPVTGRTAAGPPEVVASLTRDEAEGARGMVCARSGDLYVLVESGSVKAILKVTPAGVKTVEYDFFDRGTGDAAGIQNDLAIQRNINFLYTIDTENDMLLLYDISQKVLSEMPPGDGYDPESISISSERNERVGLVVLPGPSGF
jgi:hypothetical protein